MSDSPKPLSDTLEHPLQSRLLGAATSTAALIDRAQLAERQGRTQEARALYEQALTQLRSPEEAPIAASLLRWIGITHVIVFWTSDGANDGPRSYAVASSSDTSAPIAPARMAAATTAVSAIICSVAPASMAALRWSSRQ